MHLMWIWQASKCQKRMTALNLQLVALLARYNSEPLRALYYFARCKLSVGCKRIVAFAQKSRYSIMLYRDARCIRLKPKSVTFGCILQDSSYQRLLAETLLADRDPARILAFKNKVHFLVSAAENNFYMDSESSHLQSSGHLHKTPSKT